MSFHDVERTRTSSVSKDEKCTSKVCKITVFQCADLWGFCCCSRCGCLSSLLGNLRSYDGNCNENITLKLNFALSLLRLFHVDHVVQNRRIALSLAWYEWFDVKAKSERFTANAKYHYNVTFRWQQSSQLLKLAIKLDFYLRAGKFGQLFPWETKLSCQNAFNMLLWSHRHLL